MCNIQRLFITTFFLLSFSIIHQIDFDSPTPASRLNLLTAFSNEGTLSINKYHKNTPDKAVVDGVYYSDKAPGTSFLSFPGFYITHKLLSKFSIGSEYKFWLFGIFNG